MGRKTRGREISGWVNLDKPRELASTRPLPPCGGCSMPRKPDTPARLTHWPPAFCRWRWSEATKTVQFMQAAQKVYEVTLCWGAATQTDDAEGDIIETSDYRPSAEDIGAALPHFTGDILQTPPTFFGSPSDGVRAYKLAQAGEKVTLAPRQVHINEIILADSASPDSCILRVVCGKRCLYSVACA